MKSPKLDIFISSLPGLRAGLIATVLLLTSSIALATSESPTLAYVDSVKTWGAWNLDIQPAAGGIPTPSAQPLKARGTQLRLRTNSFTALAPIRSGVGSPPVAPPPAPVVFVPIVTPIGPGVPVPIGGPSDGF